MKKGKILSSNKELDRYLRREHSHETGRDVLQQEKRPLFTSKRTIVKIFFGLLRLLSRNILVIWLLHSSPSRRYLLSHGRNPSSPSPSWGEYLLQWIICVPCFLSLSSSRFIPSFIATPLIILLLGFLIFPLVCGLLISSLFNCISSDASEASHITLVTLKLLHKLQISLLGRDLHHPLPPYFKYEEHISQQHHLLHSGPRLSLPALRNTLQTSLLFLQNSLNTQYSSPNLLPLSPQGHISGISAKTHLGSSQSATVSDAPSLRSLQDISHAIFQSLVPQTTASLFTYTASLLNSTSPMETLPLLAPELAKILSLQSLLQRHRQDLASLCLPAPSSLHLSTQSFPLTEEATDGLFGEYLVLRKSIFSVRARYEANLQRLWLCETELADLFPLLATGERKESLGEKLKQSLRLLRSTEEIGDCDLNHQHRSGVPWTSVSESELQDLDRQLEHLYHCVAAPESCLETARGPHPTGYGHINGSGSSGEEDELSAEVKEQRLMESEERDCRRRLERLRNLFSFGEEGSCAEGTRPGDGVVAGAGEVEPIIVVHTARVLSQQELQEDQQRRRREQGEGWSREEIEAEERERRGRETRVLMMRELLPQVALIQEQVRGYERERWAEGKDDSQKILEQERQRQEEQQQEREEIQRQRGIGRIDFASLLQQSLPLLSQRKEEWVLGDPIDDSDSGTN